MIRILSRGPKWAKVRATFDDIRKIRWNGLRDPRRTLGTPEISLEIDGTENLLFTGAKAYYKQGGVWLISGYKEDSSDVMDLIYL